MQIWYIYCCFLLLLCCFQLLHSLVITIIHFLLKKFTVVFHRLHLCRPLLFLSGQLLCKHTTQQHVYEKLLCIFFLGCRPGEGEIFPPSPRRKCLFSTMNGFEALIALWELQSYILLTWV